ncbi:MAG: hypothetical protein AAF447_04310 [Myxococcota bacterium]
MVGLRRLAALVFLVACGDDSGTGTIILPDLGDQGPAPDAGDLGPEDLGPEDLPVNDLGDMGPGGCTSEEADVFALGSDGSLDARRVAVTAVDDAFFVVWEDRSRGRRLRGLRVPTTGDAGEPVDLTSGVTRPREPTLLTLDDGMLLAYTDNDTGGMGEQVLTRRLDGAGVPTAEPRVLTTGPARHVSPGLAREGTTFLASFIEADTAAGLSRAQAVTIDASGRIPTGASVRTVATSTGNLLSPRLVARDGAGYALAFVDTAPPDGRRARYAPLGINGSLDGALVDVGLSDSAREHVSIALLSQALIPMANDFLGVAFDVLVSGVRTETNVQVFDAQTAEAGGELRAHSSQQTARSPSIVAFGGGFLVAHRLVEDDTGEFETPTIALSLVDLTGALVTTLSFGDTLDSMEGEGGPVGLAVAPDGTFLLTWADRRLEGGLSFTARRVSCVL